MASLASTAALAFGGLFVVCIAVLVVAMRRVLATPVPKDQPRPDPDLRLVAREVVDEQGQRVGETVRVEGEDVVLKQGEQFLMVPKALLREQEDKLRAEGIDWAQAKERGEAWRARQQDVMAYDDKGLPVRG